MRMTCVERSAELNFAVYTFQRQAQHSGNARDAVIGNCHDNLIGAVSFPLPYPRGPYAVTESQAQGVETVGIALVITPQIVRLGPKRPVVRTQIERMKHPLLEYVDASLIKRLPLGTEFTALEPNAASKIGQNNQWLKVKDPTGTEGFVAAWFVAV